MINHIKGDMLKSTDILWAHGCNAQGKFASGVAGQLRAKFPYSYQAYITEYEKNNKLELGSVIFAVDENIKNPIIANCITQEFYGSDGKLYVSYDAIEKSLTEVLKYADEHNMLNITIPMIGAGLGGGNWEIIEKILNKINKLYERININVYSL